MRLSLVVCVSMLAAACTSSSDEPVAEPVVVTTTTTSTVPESTTTTVDPLAVDRAEIEEVITGFFAFAYDNGFVDGSPGAELLATNPILERFVRNGDDFAARGYVVGPGEVGSRIVEFRSLATDESLVAVCQLDEAQILDPDGNGVSDLTPDPVMKLIDMVRTSAGWRVADWRYLDNELIVCEL